jgi:hypothetical protein
MSREQGPHNVGMRPAAIASGRRPRNAAIRAEGSEATA